MSQMSEKGFRNTLCILSEQGIEVKGSLQYDVPL